MMAAPKCASDVARNVAKAPPELPKMLSPVMKAALALCRQFAEEGRQVTQEAIREAVGSQNFCGSTSAGILNRLEKDGYITRTFYQRGVQVCFPDGKCTAPPPNRTPHSRPWLKRKEAVPTPTIQAIRQKSHNTAMEIEAEARRLNRPLAEHLMDLVHIGHNVQQQSKGDWGDA